MIKTTICCPLCKSNDIYTIYEPKPFIVCRRCGSKTFKMKADCKECLKYNSGCYEDITIINGKCQNEERDDIKWYQHKYYRGYLLPAICQAMGESNNQYVHDFILKPEWIERNTGLRYYQYNSYNEIPAKYQQEGKARIWIDIFLDREYFCVVPSMSAFTIKEGKDYILFCETVLHIDIGVNAELPGEHKRLRDKAIK